MVKRHGGWKTLHAFLPQFLNLRFLFFLVFLFCILSPASAESPFSGFNPATLLKESRGVFVECKTLWANNAFPLRAIFFDEGWNGPFDPQDTNTMDIYWNIETGLIYQGWRIAGFSRGELFIDANKDTVEILRLIQLRENLPVGKKFDIDLKADGGFSVIGVEISKGINLNSIIKNLTTGITVRYIRGEKIQEGKMQGNVIPTGPKTYAFDLYLDYLYDHNYVYERNDTNAGSGEGYSFDLGLKYLFNKNISAEILFRDILGRIYWKRVPYTKAYATSDVLDFDENGYQIFRPTIHGFEGYKDFTQKILFKTDLSLSYRNGRFMLAPTINFIESRQPLYWINANFQARKDLYIDTSFNFNYKTFSIGLVHKFVTFNIYSNDISLNKVKAIGGTVRLQYSW
jgi:hypothetical protein